MCVPFIFTHNNTTEIIIRGVKPVKGYSVHLFQTVLLQKTKTGVICTKPLNILCIQWCLLRAF